MQCVVISQLWSNSMSKITKRKQVKTLLFIMANMSASILRQLVGTTFDIDPTKVKLSGQISPEFIPQNNCGHSWWDQAEEEYTTIWGFDVHKGFTCIAGNPENRYVIKTKLSDTLLNREYKYSRNGDFDCSEGQELQEHPDINNFLFFVVRENGKEYGKGDDLKFDNWTLYKAPDFQTYWSKLEETDIQRWKSWILDVHIQNNPTGHFADARAKGLI